MSGGYFDYDNHRLFDIAETIDNAIKNNKVEQRYGYCTDFPDDIIAKFKHVSEQLKHLNDLVHHIDYLLSGDYGEENFNEHWKESGGPI